MCDPESVPPSLLYFFTCVLCVSIVCVWVCLCAHVCLYTIACMCAGGTRPPPSLQYCACLSYLLPLLPTHIPPHSFCMQISTLSLVSCWYANTTELEYLVAFYVWCLFIFNQVFRLYFLSDGEGADEGSCLFWSFLACGSHMTSRA